MYDAGLPVISTSLPDEGRSELWVRSSADYARTGYDLVPIENALRSERSGSQGLDDIDCRCLFGLNYLDSGEHCPLVVRRF